MPLSVFTLHRGGGISQENLPFYWGFFEYVHPVRALPPSLLILFLPTP